MCEIFSKQPIENYQYISRAIRIDGHATSVKLETSFWEILEEIATGQEMTVPQFISKIYKESTVSNSNLTNLASILRCSCLIYLRQPAAVLAKTEPEVETD